MIVPIQIKVPNQILFQVPNELRIFNVSSNKLYLKLKTLIQILFNANLIF